MGNGIVHVTRHALHVTRHTLHVTRYTSRVTCGKRADFADVDEVRESDDKGLRGGVVMIKAEVEAVADTNHIAEARHAAEWRQQNNTKLRHALEGTCQWRSKTCGRCRL